MVTGAPSIVVPEKDLTEVVVAFEVGAAASKKTIQKVSGAFVVGAHERDQAELFERAPILRHDAEERVEHAIRSLQRVGLDRESSEPSEPLRISFGNDYRVDSCGEHERVAGRR